MSVNRKTSIILLATACSLAMASSAQGQSASSGQGSASEAPASSDKRIDARTWPRSYKIDGVEFSISQPQVESWEGNILRARTVMTVTMKADTQQPSEEEGVQQNFGVVWLAARTETDKEAREVILDNLSVERASFPNAAEREAEFLEAARTALPDAALVASLDAIEASLAIKLATDAASGLEVNNAPPEILISFVPAVLVPIDGEPSWRPTTFDDVDRVINTRVPILRYEGRYYLGRGGKWAVSNSLETGWAQATTVPEPVASALAKIVEKGTSNLEDKSDEPIFDSFPEIYVRTDPAELLIVDGQPAFSAIAGTSLNFVSNTNADIFLDAGNNWYVLIAGRWFTSSSTKGPWTYVPSTSLPEDFAKIPSSGPKGAVLASIAGTPEAKEALVANSIPQTATINRTEAKFVATYDGEPKFQSIAQTSLDASVNSPTPIIRVNEQSYYALEKGVWFKANSANGPWTVATSVPVEIYEIPTSSHLHYTTYVRIYGSTPDVVYVGYTPGYYGTIATGGVVVYGSGYSCNAWVGSTYYGCGATYGYGAAFAFGATVGWALTFGYGWYDPWYYPAWGPWYYPGYYPGYWGGAYYAHGNVYGHWGSTVFGGTNAAWANSWTGNYGQAFRGGFQNSATGGYGYGYAGRNTNVYTGNSVGAAGGIRYNPETGQVVGGRGVAAGNIYTGEAAAAGTRTRLDTDTGQVTRSVGGASRTRDGATLAGGARTIGPEGDAAGAGYIHYDRDSGSLSSGGVAVKDGNVYAGRDGNVYRHDGDNWQRVGRDGQLSQSQTYGPTVGPQLDQDRLARDRGFERNSLSGRGFHDQRSNRRSFDRSGYGQGYRGRMGGFRSSGRRGRRF